MPPLAILTTGLGVVSIYLTCTIELMPDSIMRHDNRNFERVYWSRIRRETIRLFEARANKSSSLAREERRIAPEAPQDISRQRLPPGFGVK